jgi:hypothetical protein
VEKKHIAVVVVGGIALIALTHYLVKRYMNQAVAATVTDASASASPQAMQTGGTIPAYTPTGNAYAPIPVGAILPGSDAHATQTPPGVTNASVLLPVIQPHKNGADAGADMIANADALSAAAPDTHVPDPTTTGVDALTGNASIIDAHYMMLFGRHADAGGLGFWKTQMDNGLAVTDLDRALTRGAQTTDQGAEVRVNPDAVIQYRA